jgi:calcineurin-like phosphoesterase family protein
MRYFTADHHFDHVKIIRYEDRPFKNVQDMNNKLIKGWNSVVKSHDDVVYVLGDLSMRGREDNPNPLRVALRKMRGVKHLILGNHDKFNPFTFVDMGFTSVHTALEIQMGGTAKHPEQFPVYLVHDPAVTRVKPEARWLCGHVHGMFRHMGNVINVGVDAWDFVPLSEDFILDEFAQPSAANEYTSTLRDEYRKNNPPQDDRLREFIQDMIDSGRLTEDMIPDDWQAICQQVRSRRD